MPDTESRTASSARARLVAAIDSLRAELNLLQERMAFAQDKLQKHDMAAAGVAIGSIVEKAGHKYRVTSVESYGIYLSLWGNPQRKDGSFGSGKRYIGMKWTVVEEERTQAITPQQDHPGSPT